MLIFSTCQQLLKSQRAALPKHLTKTSLEQLPAHTRSIHLKEHSHCIKTNLQARGKCCLHIYRPLPRFVSLYSILFPSSQLSHHHIPVPGMTCILTSIWSESSTDQSKTFWNNELWSSIQWSYKSEKRWTADHHHFLSIIPAPGRVCFKMMDATWRYPAGLSQRPVAKIPMSSCSNWVSNRWPANPQINRLWTQSQKGSPHEEESMITTFGLVCSHKCGLLKQQKRKPNRSYMTFFQPPV